MAKTPELTIEREDAELEKTASKLDKMAKAAKKTPGDPLVVAVSRKVEPKKRPTATVNIPELPASGSEGIKVDQYEHVTIANEQGEQCYKVLRGQPVDVPVEAFIQLKNRYKC